MSRCKANTALNSSNCSAAKHSEALFKHYNKLFNVVFMKILNVVVVLSIVDILEKCRIDKVYLKRIIDIQITK